MGKKVGVISKIDIHSHHRMSGFICSVKKGCVVWWSRSLPERRGGGGLA